MVTKSPDFDLELRLQQLAEIAPVHGLGRGRQIVVAGLARPGAAAGLRRRRRDQPAAGAERRRAAGRDEGALQEPAALVIEFVQQLLPMQVKCGQVGRRLGTWAAPSSSSALTQEHEGAESARPEPALHRERSYERARMHQARGACNRRLQHEMPRCGDARSGAGFVDLTDADRHFAGPG